MSKNKFNTALRVARTHARNTETFHQRRTLQFISVKLGKKVTLNTVPEQFKCLLDLGKINN